MRGNPACMAEASRALTLALLDWLVAGPRPYLEVMAAWRTSCPRFPIWEDALDQGLVCRVRAAGEDAMVELTDTGRAMLARAKLHQPEAAR